MCFRDKDAIIIQEVNMAIVFYYKCRTQSFCYSVKSFTASNTGSIFLLFFSVFFIACSRSWEETYSYQEELDRNSIK